MLTDKPMSARPIIQWSNPGPTQWGLWAPLDPLYVEDFRPTMFQPI